MKKIDIISYVILVLSIVFIGYALVFSPVDWMVYGISIVFIPLAILSLGLITMAKVEEDEKEERREEPFIGY